MLFARRFAYPMSWWASCYLLRNKGVFGVVVFRRISLDADGGQSEAAAAAAIEDVRNYVSRRLKPLTLNHPISSTSSSLLYHPTSTNLVDTDDDKLAHVIASRSLGCMLYARLIVDLIERSVLVLKSAGFRVLPHSLSEVSFATTCIRFPSSFSFMGGRSSSHITRFLQFKVMPSIRQMLDTMLEL